jgi:hypothetical protein
MLPQRLFRGSGEHEIWPSGRSHKQCIKQDDALEELVQVSQMGDIYSTAQLTIIATAGGDPTYGLPGVSS